MENAFADTTQMQMSNLNAKRERGPTETPDKSRLTAPTGKSSPLKYQPYPNKHGRRGVTWPRPQRCCVPFGPGSQQQQQTRAGPEMKLLLTSQTKGLVCSLAAEFLTFRIRLSPQTATSPPPTGGAPKNPHVYTYIQRKCQSDTKHGRWKPEKMSK